MRSLLRTATWALTTGLFAQQAVIIDLTADQVGDKVLLQFTFSKGSTCADTRVQRADTTLDFSTIGIIPGVCGSSESEETYTFVDSLPRQGEQNFYRISLAGLSYSDTISVQVIPSRSGQLLLFPSPASAELHLSLPAEGTLTVAVFAGSGAMVYKTTSTGRHVVLDGSLFGPGIHVVHVVEQGGTAFVGRFVKL